MAHTRKYGLSPLAIFAEKQTASPAIPGEVLGSLGMVQRERFLEAAEEYVPREHAMFATRIWRIMRSMKWTSPPRGSNPRARTKPTYDGLGSHLPPSRLLMHALCLETVSDT